MSYEVTSPYHSSTPAKLAGCGHACQLACKAIHTMFTLDTCYTDADTVKVKTIILIQASAMANSARPLFNHMTEAKMLDPAMLLPLPLPGSSPAWVYGCCTCPDLPERYRPASPTGEDLVGAGVEAEAWLGLASIPLCEVHRLVIQLNKDSTNLAMAACLQRTIMLCMSAKSLIQTCNLLDSWLEAHFACLEEGINATY